MKRKLTAQALILPLLVAFLVLLPLLGAAVIGEHRYEHTHPAYMRQLWLRMLGEEASGADGEDTTMTGAQATLTQGGRWNVLVMGKDATAGLTDVMMLASIDSATGDLQLLQIPRDTYANYTSRPYKKINGAYAALGADGLKEFLQDNMGVAVDRYVCVDLNVLGEMVDMIGGVHMNVPADMDYDDPAQNLHIHLKAGEQILDGETAQMFVRFRSGYVTADVGRMDAQKMFLSALAKQVKQSMSTKQMLSLVCRCFGKVKTDMTLGDCLLCAKQLREIELEHMHMASLPGASARAGGNSGAWYYILNREATAALLSERMQADGTFDPGGRFNDSRKKAFDDVYRASGERYRVQDYTATRVLEGDVSIQRIS